MEDDAEKQRAQMAEKITRLEAQLESSRNKENSANETSKHEAVTYWKGRYESLLNKVSGITKDTNWASSIGEYGAMMNVNNAYVMEHCYSWLMSKYWRQEDAVIALPLRRTTVWLSSVLLSYAKDIGDWNLRKMRNLHACKILQIT